MSRDKSRREPAFQFERYGVVQFDCATAVNDAAVLASSERNRAFEAAKSRIHTTWVEICAARSPSRKLPEPILHSISVSADRRNLRSAMRAAAEASSSYTHLVRLLIHSGFAEDISLNDLEKNGIQLLISVSPPTAESPDPGWVATKGGLAVARVSTQNLATLIHDVVLDMWMGNFLDEPYLTHVQSHFYRRTLFSSKVAFAVRKLNGSTTDLGVVDSKAGYVTFPSFARNAQGVLDYGKYISTWQEFASTLAETDTATSASVGQRLPKAFDGATWCGEAAHIVARTVGRSLKIPSLRQQLLASQAKRLVVLVLLRPPATPKQDTHIRALGLRKVNTTSVLNLESKEWASFHRLVEDLRLMGRVAVISFDRS